MKPNLPERITVFSTDIPYPPNRGGRADIWRRIQAMRSLGVNVQLVCFYDDDPNRRPTDQHLERVLSVVSSLHAYPIRKGIGHTLSRLAKTGRLPWHVACRTLGRAEQTELEGAISAFSPDYLWCEGPWCAVNAMAASSQLQIPLVYRSHNIEHLYMRRQAEAAKTGRDRLAWTVACIGLRRFESSVIRQAGWVFDISIDDMEVWRSRGVRRISWMPPLPEAALVPTQAEFKFGSVGDVIFLGNLTTPNNVRGLEWLLREIVPLVLADSPNTRFVVAGSNPGEHVRGLCAAAGVTLLPNPPDAIAVYLGARVLVNPVRTGSGTHVKAIEMLMTPLPIVTATQGTCGMPEEVKRLFHVADTAAEFARQILAALSTNVDYSSQRHDARRMFGVEGVARALEGLADRDGVRHVLART